MGPNGVAKADQQPTYLRRYLLTYQQQSPWPQMLAKNYVWAPCWHRATTLSHASPTVSPRMSLARELEQAMSSPSADKLAALAVRARQTDSQTEMVAAGVHHRLPALLQLSQSSCASPDCGTSQQECGLRQMQAQCARLLGNLSYLQAHPNPNANATPKP